MFGKRQTADEPQTLPTLSELLAKSSATPEFKAAALKLEAEQKTNELVRFPRGGNPPVKVQRILMALLEARPELAISSVEVAGQSGCSDYRGVIQVEPSGTRFKFVWDCAWKASQLGWNDSFGFPDQQRAARLYGYQCIEVLKEE